MKAIQVWEFLDEKLNKSRFFDRKAVSLFTKVTINANRPKDDSLMLDNGEVIKFKQVTPTNSYTKHESPISQATIICNLNGLQNSIYQ